MESNVNASYLTNKRGLMVASVLIAVFMIYYGVMSLLSPFKKMSELKKKIISEQVNPNKSDNILLSDSLYLRLFKEKGFYKSRIAMAETDSVYLTLTIRDSLANLEISGVVVKVSKISEIKMSRMIKNGNEYIIASFLSVPMTIIQDYATIRKEPIMVKMAPRDTSEYKPDITPDTSTYEPVSMIFKLDNGLQIYITQDKSEHRGRIKFFGFNLRNRLRNFGDTFTSIICFRIPSYKPSIKIRLPNREAKIIYRALPRNGQIAVYK